ncbi:MAG: lipoyl(octanoyl) transferase LipB [Gemmatimonadaceae bacterium]
MAERELIVRDLGVQPYAEVLSLQRQLAAERISGELESDTLLLVQHPPVVTLGRRREDNKLPVSAEFLAVRGVDLFEVERGGGVTFHGPGQLVGYPIVDLRQHKQDLHWYLRQIEEVLIRALATYDIPAERNAGFTGVWTRGRKIASIGVHARAWVTWHGFALNVSTDLSYFDLMTPCGINGVVMTSIDCEVQGHRPALESVADVVASTFGDAFSLVRG